MQYFYEMSSDMLIELFNIFFKTCNDKFVTLFYIFDIFTRQ